MRVFFDDRVAVARLRGHFDRARGFGRRLIFVNLDAIPLKGSEKVVDFFRGVHLRRERIVYFVVEQVPALFAHRDELFYRIIFFFETYCRHTCLPQSQRNPKPARTAAGTLLLSQRHRHAQALVQWSPAWPGPPRTTRGKFPKKITRILCEALCAVPLICRSPHALPAFRIIRGRSRSAKYIYIDALSGETVTR